ncbi:methyltransferase domain-containing protein [Aureisphaera galaxeae]|uniref:class I SAM-dependent methyltransferase n=1 Tax=Aureisphaera galaxeae TaxID=1538023 RepID=UPI00234FC215|nr:class I SAM-dependent methyltransferase [Aureisphaera galaxeae]MDC8005760.1 methyltransferase domain-containing protein [Aureisphaera galaxeae]
MPDHFDTSAKTYDAVFTFSEIGKAQRHRVYQFLSRNILPVSEKLNILEINCGTGEDALYLANKGHRVLATDISEAMIAAAHEKRASDNVQFLKQDITAIRKDTFSEKFDLIFSNFGGLNCLSPEQLRKFMEIAPSLLQPQGKMVWVIMPRHTLWERVYFMLKGKLKRAFQRKNKGPVSVNVEGVTVPTWYYNPQEIVHLAKDGFVATAIKPIGICIPPSYLESFFASRKKLLGIFRRMESWFNYGFWAKYADHYIIELQLK